MTAVVEALNDLAARTSGRLLLGYSGGLDSTVLLHLAANSSCLPRLAAVHVNHGLHAESDLWQSHCRQTCQTLGVDTESIRVKVQLQGQGLEAAARLARYAAFESRLSFGDILLLAHHADDQAESIMFRLCRGGEPGNLGGMPAARDLGRGRLLRPLLETSRSDLLAYAREQGLSWVEDPSNQSSAMDRNFLRNEVLPLLRTRWPGVDRNLRRLGRGVGRLRSMAGTVLNAELASVSTRATLDLAQLQTLEAERARELFAEWLSRRILKRPGYKLVDEMLRQLLSAAPDRNPVFSFSGSGDKPQAWQLHRYGDHVCLAEVPKEKPVAFKVALLDSACWEAETPGGRVRLFRGSGTGLCLPADACISIQFRSRGLALRFAGGHGTLKRLLQEQQVPGFLRWQLPLLTVGGELAAIPGIYLSRAHSGAEGNWQFAWYCNALERWWLCGARQLR